MAGNVQLVHRGAGAGGPFEIWQASVAGLVNLYLVKPAKGPSSLVDSGPGKPETAATVRQLLSAAKVEPAQVDRIAITHGHPAHAGGAAQLLGLLPRAELCASAYDSQFLRRSAQTVDDDLRRLKVQFRRWGAPSESKDIVAAALDHYRLLRVIGGAPPEVKTELRSGSEVVLGGARFKVFEAPGHHEGALLFYHENGGELFSGDNVAMEPVPVPALTTDRSGERILSGPVLVDGLERVKDLKPKMIFPGHGPVIGNPEHVLDEEIHYYRGNAQRLMARLIDEKMSAWDIAGEREPEKIIPRISLIFCFLDLLLREAAVDCKLEKGVDRYHVPL